MTTARTVELFVEKGAPKPPRAPKASKGTGAQEAPAPAQAPAGRTRLATIVHEGDALLVTDALNVSFRFAPGQFGLAQTLLNDVPYERRLTLAFARPDGSTVERYSECRSYIGAEELLGLIWCWCA